MRYLFVLCALAGCTTRFAYAPEDEQRFREDEFYCERLASSQVNPGDRAQLYDKCMYAKGWRPGS